ncbi:MAG TPA: helix-turn-helix domain-containing protein [Candidatus Dormibacteraeota bacterium]|nr:helix-turn-helix domain-containing protein [Candidatus Dormibacteraeota bacterium]
MLDAARRLFTERGYAATSRQAVARAAGVAPQTVAAVAGTKRGLLEAVVDDAARSDGQPLPVALRSWLQELREQADAASLLRAHARSSAEVSRHTAGVTEAFRRAAAADPGIAELWEDFSQQRRRGQATVVELLAQRGPLRTGLSQSEAADVLWVLTDDALYSALVGERGWSHDRFAAWCGDTMCRTLLRPETFGNEP